MPTISRRLASEGTVDPSDLRSLSLPGASPGAPTGVWFAGNSRPVRLKPEQPWECKSPHADQFWNVNRTSEPGLFAKQCAPCKGSVVRVHGIPPCARSSKRAGGLIPRIALDQCRVPERYRTRVPFRTPEREVARAAQRFQKVLSVSRWKRPAGSLILCPHSSKHRAGAS